MKIEIVNTTSLISIPCDFGDM